jgi:biopolymer transport protein ExbD
MAAMKKKKGHGAGSVELNMVPMIDVVFQLLIFLMVMPATGETEGYLPTNLPTDIGQGEGKPPPKKKINQLRIDLLHVEPWEQHKSEVRIVLNSEELRDFAALRIRLREAEQSLRSNGADMAKAPVLISPDMVVWHKHVVAAFDSAVDAGFKNIMFTIPK